MQVLLIHRREAPDFPEVWHQRYAHWQTCLRELVIMPLADKNLWADSLHANYDVLQGEDALRFLVEICSGLHSPVLGETEVLGQFRAKFLGFKHADAVFERQVQEFIDRVLECTKRVREQCLKTGSTNSYGSLSRKLVKGFHTASFLGAGQLAAEILPWLEKLSVDIHARAPEKAQLLAAKHSRATVKSVVDAPTGEVLVVLAPMNTKDLSSWISTAPNKPKLLLDLRADSTTAALANNLAEQIITLQDFFNVLQENESKRAGLVKEAHALLDQILRRQRERVEYRPFGWEDVCV